MVLLENNATMTKENQDIITGIMGVEPIYINSNLLTAQERKKTVLDKHTGH